MILYKAMIKIEGLVCYSFHLNTMFSLFVSVVISTQTNTPIPMYSQPPKNSEDRVEQIKLK